MLLLSSVDACFKNSFFKTIISGTQLECLTDLTRYTTCLDMLQKLYGYKTKIRPKNGFSVMSHS